MAGPSACGAGSGSSMTTDDDGDDSSGESSPGPEAPPDLVDDLADTLDAMIDRPLVGVELFGGEGPVIGQYALKPRLGAGATSVVYEAHDTRLDRPVALKIVARPDADGAWRARVLEEARALARLSHPNVVAVYDVGEWRGHPFMAMELVTGRTLARWQVERRRAWPALVRHYLAAGHGLDAAHARGLVHRDFKPANVLVADSGRVAVTDFGLATLAEPAPVRAAGTPAHGIGTPAYLAPEQREGAPPRPSADVYSFAVALCEALVGQHPLFDPAFDWRGALRRTGLPGRARAAIEHGMEADPALRWPRLGPLIAALEAALPARPASPVRAFLRRRATGVALALGVGAMAGVGRCPADCGAHDTAPQLELARRLAATDPAAADRMLLAIPASQRGAGWIEVARTVLLQPIPRELRCGGGARPAIASVGHGLVAVIDARGRASVCDLAAERTAPLAEDAACARVLDDDHVGVITTGGELAVFDRRAGWRARPPLQLDPEAAAQPPRRRSRCERDLAIPGPRALAMRRGGAWQLIDLDAPSAGGTVEAAALVGVSRDLRRALVRDARGDLMMAPIGGPTAPAPPPLAAAPRLAYDPASRVAVAARGDDSAAIDVERGTVLRRDRLPPLSWVELAPGGRMAVGLGWRGGILWWPLAGETTAPRLELVSDASVQQVAFNPTGTRLAWRDSAGGVGVRDVGRASGHVLRGSGGSRSMCGLTFVTDDRVAAVSCDGRVLAWDMSEQQTFVAGQHELGHCQPPCNGALAELWYATVDSTGSVAATTGREGTIGIWPLGGGALEPARLPVGPGRRSFLAAFDGDLLLVGNADPVAQLWSWRTRQLVADLPGHEGWTYAVAVAHPAPRTTTFVTGSRGGTGFGPATVRFWRQDGSLLAAQIAGGTVLDLATSPSGRLVAAALGSGDVAIYDAASGAPRGRVPAHQGQARRVVFLDEASLISAGDDGVLQQIALDADRGGASITRSILAHSDKIYDLDLRGTSLLTASHDGKIRLWDLRRDEPLVRTYHGHKRPVTVVRWHRDGTRFVSGDGDTSGTNPGDACVWRVDRDTCQVWLTGHRKDIRAAQFIDDERVMTAALDGTVRVWTPLPTAATADDLAAALARRAPAGLDER
jgi:WD40 repeat protein/predicted Ser/Thr protein kinase